MHVPIRPLYQLGVLRRLWATTLFLLFAIDTTSALSISFLTPVATTIWTTGQDATVSLNCSDPYAATFPVILYTGPQDQPVPGVAPLGQISCSSSLTIKVPTTIPSGSSYFIGIIVNPTTVLVSVSFTITNPATTSKALTATATTINGTSTTAITTTTTTTTTSSITTFSSTPKSNNDIDPLNRDSTGNGAAIGGGIAGAVIAIAAVVVLLVFRRRQKCKNQPINTNGSGADPLPGNVLSSNEKTSDGGECERYSQTKPSNKSRMSCTKVPTAIDTQSTSGSPHSWPGSFQDTKSNPSPILFSFSRPSMPSLPVSSSGPQENGQAMQQQLAFHQEQLANQRSPQYVSSGHPHQTSSSLRGPEEVRGTALTSSNYELQQ